MAEKKQKPKVVPSIRQPVLKVTHEEALRLIEQQLEKGRRILQSAPKGKITTMRQLDPTADELVKWDRFNSSLLRYNIFSIPSFADKYDELPTPEKVSSIADYVGNLEYFYRTRKLSLESIKAQLPLFDIAPRSVSATYEGAIDKKNVIVVYGRNEKLKKSMFDFLNAVGLRPLDWIQLKTAAIKSTGKGTPYTGEIVANAFEQRAVLVLLTGDDKAILRKKFWKKNDPPYERELTPQARPNVLFEAGMAIGRSDERTILVEIGTVRKWTDIAGRHVTEFDGSYKKRHELIEQLKAIDCEVDIAGSHWMDAGDFEEEPDSQESNRSSQEPIHALKKQPVGKETPLGSINQRVKRILDLKNAKKQSEDDWKNCGKFEGYLKGTEITVKLPTRGDNFQLYFLWNEDTVSDIWLSGIWYVAVFASEVNIQVELAAIRVLMEKCRQLENDKCTFIIATNEDLASQRNSIQRAFDTKKGFIHQDTRQLFSLEIWDKHSLIQKEKELGILG